MYPILFEAWILGHSTDGQKCTVNIIYAALVSCDLQSSAKNVDQMMSFRNSDYLVSETSLQFPGYVGDAGICICPLWYGVAEGIASSGLGSGVHSRFNNCSLFFKLFCTVYWQRVRFVDNWFEDRALTVCNFSTVPLNILYVATVICTSSRGFLTKKKIILI